MKQIKLTKGLFALVDAQDFDELSKFNWQASSDGNGRAYARRSIKGKKSVTMHRELLRAKPSEFVDHINGNTLDNRRENIRICSRAQNTQNSRNLRKSKSGYIGVHIANRCKDFTASIKVSGKTIYRRGFKTAEDAAREYDKLAREHFGKNARTNFSLESEEKG